MFITYSTILHCLPLPQFFCYLQREDYNANKEQAGKADEKIQSSSFGGTGSEERDT